MATRAAERVAYVCESGSRSPRERSVAALRKARLSIRRRNLGGRRGGAARLAVHPASPGASCQRQRVRPLFREKGPDPFSVHGFDREAEEVACAALGADVARLRGILLDL